MSWLPRDTAERLSPNNMCLRSFQPSLESKKKRGPYGVYKKRVTFDIDPVRGLHKGVYTYPFKRVYPRLCWLKLT